jgi:hypothetical protein
LPTKGLVRADDSDQAVFKCHPPLHVCAGCLEQLIGEGNIDSCDSDSAQSAVSLLLHKSSTG